MMTAFKVGSTYKAKLGVDDPYKIHVLAIVDDNQIVFKFYGYPTQTWNYRVMNNDRLRLRILSEDKK